MSEERRQVHPQEPAEGAEENVEAPGAEREGDSGNPGTFRDAEKQSSEHPQEPAEGAEDSVEASDAVDTDDGD